MDVALQHHRNGKIVSDGRIIRSGCKHLPIDCLRLWMLTLQIECHGLVGECPRIRRIDRQYLVELGNGPSRRPRDEIDECQCPNQVRLVVVCAQPFRQQLPCLRDLAIPRKGVGTA